MSVFGWSYPAGAEHDPRAPWNAPAHMVECDECGHQCEYQDENEVCDECDEGHMRYPEPAEPDYY